MFLTITIDTSANKSGVKLRKKKGLSWWKKPLNKKRRSIDQRVRGWIKQLTSRNAFTHNPIMGFEKVPDARRIENFGRSVRVGT